MLWSMTMALAVGVIASLVMTALLMGANVMSTRVDRAPIRSHVAQAFANGDLDAAFHLRTDTKRGAHQFNDCLILLMVLDERLTPEQRAMSPLKAGVDGEDEANYPCPRLREFVAGEVSPLTSDSPYHRYLHGHVAIAAPLIAALPLDRLRMVFDFLMYASILGALCLGGWRLRGGLAAMRRGDPIGLAAAAAPGAASGANSVAMRGAFGALAALTLLLFFGLQFYGMSLSHFPSDIVLVAYIYMMILIDFQRWPVWAGALLHGAFGAVTAYVEFFTGGIPLGLCLIMFAYASGALAGHRDAPVLRAFAAAAAFGVGVVAAFVLKLALTVAAYGPDVIQDFTGQLSYRVAGASVMPWDVVIGLLTASHYLGAGWRLLGATLLALPAIGWVICTARVLMRARATPPSPGVVLLICATLAIYGWWFAMAQHSFQHGFFMVRIGVGAIFSVVALAACVYASSLRSLLADALKALGGDARPLAEAPAMAQSGQPVALATEKAVGA